jgi:ketosteroid isomerase-like protein
MTVLSPAIILASGTKAIVICGRVAAALECGPEAAMRSFFWVVAAMVLTTPAMMAQSSDPTRTTVERFNDAINGHDLTGVASLLDEHTVFENTSPAPDGTRIEGKAAVVAFWEKWFAANPGARFDAEEIIVAGDRCIVRWIYRKMRDGKPWHLRGVDVLTVHNGRIVAKLAYVKG